MAFDGSGNYILPATTVTPAVADTIIDPTEFNTFTSDLATALSLCLTEDGQNAPTANLPMATNRHTGVGDATSLTDYASANQVVDNTLHYGGASAVGTDAYAVNLPISPGAYVAGNRYQFIADVANTGACSINFSSIGVKSIKMQDGNDPVDNYILANSIVDVEYNGTNMVLIGVPSVGVNLASPQTLTNKTLTTPTLTAPVINTSVSGTAVLDEDDMVSNSATQLATQQSIKAYADANSVTDQAYTDTQIAALVKSHGGRVASTGAMTAQSGGLTSVKLGTGSYRITHNFGHTTYAPQVNTISVTNQQIAFITAIATNTFDLETGNISTGIADSAFSFTIAEW